MAATLLCLSGVRAAFEESSHAPYVTKSVADCPSLPVELEHVVPQRMQYRDITRAVATTLAAFASDPLNHFLKDTPDSTPPSARTLAVRKALLRVQFANDVRSGALWTVARGASFIRIGDPAQAPDALARIVARLVRGLTVGTLTKMQRARYNAFVAATEAAIETSLGDSVADMLLIEGLATDPECQGRGYASALVRVATDLADATGISSWLVSSNVSNRGFYGSCGFATVHTFYMGPGDPTWTRAPVPIEIMVREVNSVAEKC